MIPQQEAEFSRTVRVDQIPLNGMALDLVAKPAEREALAVRFGLQSLESLSASVSLRAIAGGTVVQMKGHIDAKVVQTCVVTLEPVPAEVSESFSQSFTTEEEDLAPGTEIELAFDEEDPPDPVVDGAIDVGEVVAEHLALALDPFPRKDGASFAGGDDSSPEPEKRPSPFAVLAELRKNKG